jgi:triosephosphate isomerase
VANFLKAMTIIIMALTLKYQRFRQYSPTFNILFDASRRLILSISRSHLVKWIQSVRQPRSALIHGLPGATAGSVLICIEKEPYHREGLKMRKPFVAGNWKMNKVVAEAAPLVAELLPGLQAVTSVTSVLCPPFTALMPISAMLEGTEIGLGAQDLHWEESGAYTGEVSPAMVKEFCQYVIIGHSERRTLFGESDETVNRKVKAAMNVGLIPIVCIGETLEENETNQTMKVVNRQVREGLQGLTLEQAGQLVIAYEPVWAIGTGRAANPESANHIHKDVVRAAISKMFGDAVAGNTRILYGGSVKGDNAADYFKMSDIDGALVGGASLKAAEFLRIVEAAAP